MKNSIPLVKKFIVVPAPVKSGKRGMVEISSLLYQTFSHVFVSAWHRTADKNQREELESFGIKVCSVNNKNKKNCCIKIISHELKENNNVIIHLDELDFGAGDGQLLSDIWNEYKIEKRAKFIMYSASHEVAMKEFLIVKLLMIFIYVRNLFHPKHILELVDIYREKKWCKQLRLLNMMKKIMN